MAKRRTATIRELDEVRDMANRLHDDNLTLKQEVLDKEKELTTIQQKLKDLIIVLNKELERKDKDILTLVRVVSRGLTSKEE